jgi:hypothetical protein
MLPHRRHPVRAVSVALMISTALARLLRDAGLVWHPGSGDRFQIDRADFDGEIFTVSDLTIEPHHHPSGTVLGFNGTTEWALDSVAVDDALWLPREDQLRDLLRGAFRLLERVDEGYCVTAVIGGVAHRFESVSAPEAYGLAVLALLERVRA